MMTRSIQLGFTGYNDNPKLNETAKKILRAGDIQTFRRQYGDYYVKGYAKGAYLGFYKRASKKILGTTSTECLSRSWDSLITGRNNVD